MNQSLPNITSTSSAARNTRRAQTPGANNNNNNTSLSNTSVGRGKVARYSSMETEFSPAHVPIGTVEMSGMVSRLYTPDLIRRRNVTAQRKEARERTRLQYDATQDAHLAAFWSRQQELKQQRMKEREVQEQRIETAHSMVLSPSSSHRRRRSSTPTASGKPPREKQQQIEDSQNTDSDDSNAYNSSKDSQASSPRRAATASRSPSSSRSSRSRSSSSNEGGYSSAEFNSPPASPEKQQQQSSSAAGSPAKKEEEGSASRKRSRVSFHRKKGEEEKQGANSTQQLGTLCGLNAGDFDLVRSFLGEPTKELLASRAFARCMGVAIAEVPDPDMDLNEHHRASTSASPSHHRSRGSKSEQQGDEGAVVVQGSNKNEEEDDLSMYAEPLQDVRRRDLTALWMLAKPPPSYRKIVNGLGLEDGDFDLRWLRDGKPPPAPGVGTILQLPVDIPEEEDRFSVSSPRSVIVLLRNGLALSNLMPRSLESFYVQGSLKGLPVHVSEKRFIAHDKERKVALRKATADYTTLCGKVPQAHLVKTLNDIDPDRHPDFPIRFDNAPIRAEGSNNSKLSRKLSNIGNAAKTRKSVAAENTYRAREKFEMHLKRNMEMTKKKVVEVTHRHKHSKKKIAAIEAQRAANLEERRQVQRERDVRVKQVVAEARVREELRKQVILDKIVKHDQKWEEMQEMRRFSQVVEAEEKKIVSQTKRDNMERHEKRVEFEKLCTIDRIRRKMEKAEATLAAEREVTNVLRQERGRAHVEMEHLNERSAAEVLAYQRKELTDV